MRKAKSRIAVLLVAVMAFSMIPVNISYANPEKLGGSVEPIKSVKASEIAQSLNNSSVEQAGEFSAVSGAKGFVPDLKNPDINDEMDDEIIVRGIVTEHSGNEYSDLQQASGVPSYYDMRNQSYASRIKVKNQEETGLCWAFAATTAAEINYYHKYGANAASKTLSPLHLGYFTYNRVTDPLQLTRGDQNIIINGKDYKSYGGNISRTLNTLSGWVGYASESTMPFSDRNRSSYSSSKAYQNELILRNAIVLDPQNRTKIKQAIMTYGSVVTDIYMADPYKNYVNSAGVYRQYETTSNHQVTIIGWDDSKSARIIQNSWGANWDDDGCFYVSYYEPSMESMMAIEIQDKSLYDLNYYYDGTESGASLGMSSGTRAANMYVARSDGSNSTYQMLEAVGLTLRNKDDGTYTYRIDIYTGCRPSQPTSGTRAVSFTAQTGASGYYTLPLPYAIEIPDGERYSIVITLGQYNYVAAETPTVRTDKTTLVASPAIQTGQSFWANGTGGFSDCASLSGGYCFRIKGLATENTARVIGTNYEGYRISGSDRVNTAAEICRLMLQDRGISKHSTVIVADAQNFPDALAGSYLSKVNGNAPILLVNPYYEYAVAEYIRDVVKSGGKVYILGGTGVISYAFERYLDNYGYNVERLAGYNRYETNLAVLKEAGVTNQEILVCDGNGYADSLSASAVGKPILLVDKELSSAQRSYLSSIRSNKAYLVGGTGAVTSTVESQMKSRGYSTVRFAGLNRYQTSAMVAEYFFGTSATDVIFAYGQNFPDGLAGGPYALQEGGPLLLVDNYVSNVVYAKDYAHNLTNLKEAYVLGGPTLVSDAAIIYICK